MRTFHHADGILDGPTAIVIAPSAVWIGSDLDSGRSDRSGDATRSTGFALDGITGGMAVDGNGDVWVTVRAQAV